MTDILFLAAFVFCYKVSLKLIPLFLGRVVIAYNEKEPQIRQAKAAIAVKKLEQSKISAKDEFAKHAKIQREINKLTLELQSVTKECKSWKTKVDVTSAILLRVVFTVLLIFVMVSYKGKSIGNLPKLQFWPLHYLLHIPLGVPGTLSAPAWVFVCFQTWNALF